MEKERFSITTTRIGVCIALLMLMWLIGSGFAEGGPSAPKESLNITDSSSKVRWLVFSSTDHAHERGLVQKWVHISARDSKSGRIYIALADLNDDGIKEIFAYIEIAAYCGQMGCPLGIYQIKNRKLKSLFPSELSHGIPMSIEMDSKGNQNVIGILSSKTMGWRDIANSKEAVWKWNGQSY
jgi:hypothetical protein